MFEPRPSDKLGGSTVVLRSAKLISNRFQVVLSERPVAFEFLVVVPSSVRITTVLSLIKRNNAQSAIEVIVSLRAVANPNAIEFAAVRAATVRTSNHTRMIS